MTYLANNNIQASDYNTFAGVTGSAAASAAAATAKAGHLYGIGFGDRGYGQSTPSLVAKVAGDVVGQEWQTLRTVMVNLANWQNTSIATLPAAASFNAGAAITAHSAISSLLSSLDTNRLNSQAVNMATSSLITSTRATTWGAGSSSIVCELRVAFADENQARYFFNTGGELRVSLIHPSTLTARDQSWNTVLNNLTIALRAHTSVRTSGSYGAAQNLGFYELLTTDQTILNGTNTGITPYGVNDFTVAARVQSVAGLNGGNGTAVVFRVTLTDEQTNGFSDIVQSGTAATVS